jgi:hypothetical protein
MEGWPKFIVLGFLILAAVFMEIFGEGIRLRILLGRFDKRITKKLAQIDTSYFPRKLAHNKLCRRFREIDFDESSLEEMRREVERCEALIKDIDEIITAQTAEA